MHTPLCGHAAGDPVEYVEAAAQRGIDLITFTCHAPMRNEAIFAGAGIRMRLEQLEDYFEIVGEARRRGREIGVEVLTGIEAEYFPEEDELQELWRLLGDQDFDFVLGSLHHQLPGFRSWIGRFSSEEAIAAAYFEQLGRAVRTGRYDSIAHPDLIRIYGTIDPFEPEEQEEAIRGFLRAAVESGTCLEVNTSGLIKGVFEVHPAPSILRWAREEGVRLTLGSDAHHPSQLGQFFEPVCQLLRETGFDRIHYFRRRERFERML